MLEVWPVKPTAFGRVRPRRSAMPAVLAGGLRFEDRVTKWLEASYNFHPQIEFESRAGFRFRPDGLLFTPEWDRLCVVEIKTQASQQALAQLLRYCVWLGQWFLRPPTGLLVTGDYRSEVCRFVAPMVQTPKAMLETEAFGLGVVAVTARSLPRLRGVGCGLGVGAAPSDAAVRPVGSSRNDIAGGLGSVCVVAA